MTIDEAIKILNLMGEPGFNCSTEDILAARKLGIEALKRHKDQQFTRFMPGIHLLPGETEEEEREVKVDE